MNNFWGMDADVVSWDYSMNEAGGKPEGLEAYIRHVMRLDRAPKLIVKDTHMAEARRNILKAVRTCFINTQVLVACVISSHLVLFV